MKLSLSSKTILLTLISGFLLILSFPPFDIGFFAWIALVPFFYSLELTPANKSYLAAFNGLLLGIIFFYGCLYWLYNVFGFFGLGLVLIGSIFTLSFSLIAHRLFLTGRVTLMLIFIPALWLALEYFRSELWWLKFSWLGLGYSQHALLPFLQFANIGGQYGLSFVIIAMNLLFVLIYLEDIKWKRFVLAIACIFFIISLIGYGLYSLMEDYSPSIDVALVQDERPDFANHISLSSGTGADIIVWPEYAVPQFINPTVQSKLSSLAQNESALFIFGGKDRAMVDPGFYNAAFIFSSEGEPIGVYHKMNPIQFFLDGVPGKNYSVFSTEEGKIGVLICYDMDYASVARNIVKNGAELLIIPTYDAMRWGALQHQQHSAMTSMRAVENGRYVARSASSGISQIIDPKGRVTHELAIGERGVLIGKVGTSSTTTIYSLFGHLLAPICLCLTLICTLLLVFKIGIFS